MQALLFGFFWIWGLTQAATVDPDACGLDFSGEVREVLLRREAWDNWASIIAGQEDLIKKRIQVWKDYRETLNYYSIVVTQELRTFSEMMANYYQKELKRIEDSKTKLDPPRPNPSPSPSSPLKPSPPLPPPPSKPSPPTPPPPKPSPPLSPPPPKPDDRYERMEASTYKFMSKLLDLVDFNFRKFNRIATVVSWSVESQTTTELYQALTEISRVTSSTKIDSIKIIAENIITCARLGRTDFKSLATVNEELTKLKSAIKPSEKNQIASEWASDWMLRMDLTLKKSMNRQSQLSQNSQERQGRFFALKKSSSEYTSVISWDIMRSEEMLTTAEQFGDIEMNSIKAIVKSSMKMTDFRTDDTDSWLTEVNRSTQSQNFWTSENKDFWASSTFDDVQSRKYSSSSFTSSASTEQAFITTP